MEASTLLADPHAIRLETIRSAEKSLTLVVRAVRCRAECPSCRRVATRVHSRYVRCIADLPWQGVAVRLALHTRRFFCGNSLCTRRIFCERLPAVVARYACRTARLNDALTLIGFITGGEAGARLARQLGMSVSPDTLIRRIREAPLPATTTPRVLGIDDWAQRKGQTYGTVLVDLERHRPIDLLPDREAATIATWLREHPGVEVVSRDRFRAYKEGVTCGAPDAVQVANRWHLLRNMTEALERWLGGKRRAIRQAAKDAATPSVESVAANMTRGDAGHALPTRTLQRSTERIAVRQARFEEVRELYAQGATIRGIAIKFRMHRRTVRLLVNADECPERAPPRRRPNQLDPYLPYLKRRWMEGCHNAGELWREIKAQGFAGCESAARHFIGRWRLHVAPELRRKRHLASGAPASRIIVLGARTVTWSLLRDANELNDKQRAFVTRLCEQQPEVVTAQRLVRRFQHLVSRRDAAAFDAWLMEAKGSKLPELMNFAAGLGKDAAVRAALTCEWSNGQVEGQVNRLKTIKRQMFGRANFDLLRRRVLHVAA